MAEKMSTTSMPCPRDMGCGDGTDGSIPAKQAGTTPTSPAASGPTGDGGSSNKTIITGGREKPV